MDCCDSPPYLCILHFIGVLGTLFPFPTTCFLFFFFFYRFPPSAAMILPLLCFLHSHPSALPVYFLFFRQAFALLDLFTTTYPHPSQNMTTLLPAHAAGSSGFVLCTFISFYFPSTNSQHCADHSLLHIFPFPTLQRSDMVWKRREGGCLPSSLAFLPFLQATFCLWPPWPFLLLPGLLRTTAHLACPGFAFLFSFLSYSSVPALPSCVHWLSPALHSPTSCSGHGVAWQALCLPLTTGTAFSLHFPSPSTCCHFRQQATPYLPSYTQPSLCTPPV